MKISNLKDLGFHVEHLNAECPYLLHITVTSIEDGDSQFECGRNHGSRFTWKKASRVCFAKWYANMRHVNVGLSLESSWSHDSARQQCVSVRACYLCRHWSSAAPSLPPRGCADVTAGTEVAVSPSPFPAGQSGRKHGCNPANRDCTAPRTRSHTLIQHIHVHTYIYTHAHATSSVHWQ